MHMNAGWQSLYGRATKIHGKFCALASRYIFQILFVDTWRCLRGDRRPRMQNVAMKNACRIAEISKRYEPGSLVAVWAWFCLPAKLPDISSCRSNALDITLLKFHFTDFLVHQSLFTWDDQQQ